MSFLYKNTGYDLLEEGAVLSLQGFYKDNLTNHSA